MPLVLNEDQRLLKKTAREFFSDHAPLASVRTRRDETQSAAHQCGYDPTLWEKMIEMGWPGIIIAEQYGGLDFGYTGLGCIAEASGRTLASSPLFSSIALCANAIALLANEAQKQSFLPQLANGACTQAFALQEGAHYQAKAFRCEATKTASGFVLNGQKRFVLDGGNADHLLVVTKAIDSLEFESTENKAATEHFALLLVKADTPGVRITPHSMIDTRNNATIEFDQVTLSPQALLGGRNHALSQLEHISDCGNIILAAEMLGSARAAFEQTMDYLKQRRQFDVAIGSFQALQHRAAQMFCEIEMSKSVVLKALHALDERSADTALYASLAKAHLCNTLKLVSNEAIQMHGGMGMTDEANIGLFVKRARVAQQTLGDEDYHLSRYASLRGY